MIGKPLTLVKSMPQAECQLYIWTKTCNFVYKNYQFMMDRAEFQVKS